MESNRKIYTKTGDLGCTGTFKGSRVSKAHVIVETCGEIDELMANLGLVFLALKDTDYSQKHSPSLHEQVLQIQKDLFEIGAELMTLSKEDKFAIHHKDVEKLESQIDDLDKGLPPLTRFILPSSSYASSLVHVARAICRRAERVIIARHECELGEYLVRQEVMAYINRLSDYLFILARRVVFEESSEENEWIPRERT